MGIPLGHKLKILKKIKDAREEKGLTASVSRSGTTKSEISYQEGSSSRPVTNYDYEPLPEPVSESST
jgi:hypothetical protein